MAKTRRPRRINRYGGQFKLTAARLSNTPGVQVKDVAEVPMDIENGYAVSPFRTSKTDTPSLIPVPR